VKSIEKHNAAMLRYRRLLDGVYTPAPTFFSKNRQPQYWQRNEFLPRGKLLRICLLGSAFIRLRWFELARIYFFNNCKPQEWTSESITIYFTGKLVSWN